MMPYAGAVTDLVHVTGHHRKVEQLVEFSLKFDAVQLSIVAFQMSKAFHEPRFSHHSHMSRSLKIRHPNIASC